MKLSQINKPNLLSIIGSHLYGLNTESSDIDIRGFVLPPIEYLIGIKNFDKYEDKDNDIVIFSLKKFLNMLISGNIQMLETIYSNKILECDEIGQKILENKHLFISKRYYRTIRGFALSELRKAKGQRLVIKGETDSETELINKFTGKFNLTRLQRNEILTLLEEYTGKKFQYLINNTEQIGKQRKDSILEIGYSRKNAAHCIRLLYEGITLMKHNNLVFPLPKHQQDAIKEIRFNDTFSKEHIENLYDKLSIEFQNAYEVSSLPDNADIEGIDNLYLEIVYEKLYNLERQKI